MDTVNWRFNSNSDVALEFRGFHYQLAATIKNVLVVGYHLKGFLFDGHFPHYISLDWVPLNCWDMMRYQPRSYWYLEQVCSGNLFCPPVCTAWPVSASSHGTHRECGTFYESEEIKCRHGMEYSIWTAWILFIPDNSRLPTVTRHNDVIIELCFARVEENLFFIKSRWMKLRKNCCVNVCKFEQNKEHKTFPISGRVWPELQPSVYYFSGCMNSSRKILWRICGHCPSLLSVVINSLTSPASVPQSPGGCFELSWKAEKLSPQCGDWPGLGLRCLRLALSWAEEITVVLCRPHPLILAHYTDFTLHPSIEQA